MSVVREVLFVGLLIVMVVSCQALAGRHQRSSPTDEPVSVSYERKQSPGTWVKNCMKSETASFKVRFAAIKGQTTSFSRALMNMPTIETYASKLQNVSSRHIGNCAVLAEAGGFEGFSFNNGMCKMFSLERQPCRGDAGTGDVIYVQDSFWDETDPVLPVLGAAGPSGPVEYFRYPSSVIDQRDKLGETFVKPSGSLVDAWLLNYSSKFPGLAMAICKGLDSYMTMALDTDHCATCCVGCSDWILQKPLIIDDQGIPEVTPTTYFLSNCGQTIKVNEVFPKNGTSKIMVVHSHEGFGCKWYPKPAEDHDCVVTFEATRFMIISYMEHYLDGDSSTCHGDQLLIYDGRVHVATYNACDEGDGGDIQPYPLLPNGTVVFKRSATQYRTDGLNVGFVLYLENHST